MAAPELKEFGDGDTKLAEHVSDTSLQNAPATTRSKRQAPELVRDLAPEERQRLEKILVRKIDIRLLPMLIIIYIMNYLDRNNIAAARLAGLQEPKSKGGINLGSTQYLTALSILFVGYILMQIPSNLFLNKIGKPAIYLPTVMIAWGTISAATAGAQSYGGLVAIRFFLGFVEAAYFPGCLFFLSCWYTRKELGFRTAMLYSGSLLSGAFSGLISAGIKNGLDGAKGLRAWRWLFIIEGVITIFIAFIAYFVLPNFPRTTSWLTEEERQLAVWRLDEDIGEDDWVGSGPQTFFHGMKLAFQDIKMWILVGTRPLCHTVYSCDVDGASIWFRCGWHGHESLPDSSRNTWIWGRGLPPSHGASLHVSSLYLVSQCMACRQNRRTVLPHHRSLVLRGHCLHNSCNDNFDWSAVFCYDAYAGWSLHWLCCSSRLDIQHPA